MYLPLSRCYPLEKIVSDDSWHIPGFLSTLSNCWTQKSLVAERLNVTVGVCFSQASWISTRDGSAFNFPRDATLFAIWGFPSGLKQGKINYWRKKTKTWKTEKILFYPNRRRKAFSHRWNVILIALVNYYKKKRWGRGVGGFNRQIFRDVLN